MPTRNRNYTELYLNRPGQVDPLVPNTPTQDYTAYGTMTPPVRTMQDPSFATDPFRGMGQAFAGQMGSQVMAPPTPVDMNEEVAYTGKTLREIYQDTRREELASLADFREIQRQSAARQGSTMYEQAQMAMSQRQLMSDTRGLTGGAREFAQTGATAQEQMVLSQIQNATFDQLLQIDAQSLQDSKIADETALRTMQIQEQLDPRFRELNVILRQADIALQTGKEEEYSRLMNNYFEQTDALYGTNLAETLVSATGGPNTDTLVKALSDLRIEQTPTEQVMGWAMPVLGAGAVGKTLFSAAAGSGKIAGALGLGSAAKGTIGSGVIVGKAILAANPVGLAILGAAAIGLTAYAIYNYNQNKNLRMSGEQADEGIRESLEAARAQFKADGYTDAQIETYIKDVKQRAGLPPRYDSW